MWRVLVFLCTVACLCESFAQDIYLTPLAKYQVPGKKITSISISPASKLISVANAKNEIAVLKLEDGQKVFTTNSSSALALQEFYDDENLLVLDRNGKLTKYPLSSGEPISATISTGIKAACLDPTHQYVSALLKENVVEIFDLKSRMTAGRISVKNVIKDVGYFGYDRFAQQVAVISNTGEAYSWNPLNQKFLRELKLQSTEYANSSSIIHASSSNSASDRFVLAMEEVFIPQGGFMNTSSVLERRNSLVAFDWVSGQEVKKLPVKYQVDGMAAGPGPSHLSYFSSASQAIVLINLEKSEASSVVSVDEKPTAISLSTDGQFLVVGTVTGGVYIYEVIRNNPVNIKITSPKLNRSYGDQIVKESKIKIEGEIEGHDKIAKVFVDGKPIPYEYDRKFSTEVNLVNGKNRIRVGIQTAESVVTERDFYLTCQIDTTRKNRDASATSSIKKLALVIGNSNYEYANKLINTSNDAKAMATTLRSLGFEVISVTDGDYEKMKNSIYAFGEAITDVDVSLFYYAGHGLEVDGTNYLVPVDAKVESALEVRLKAVPLTAIIRTMEFANDEGLNMIILDACRNNPFPTGKRGGTGLARVAAPSGTLIAYATDPGATASDGDGKNGLYTGELVKQLNIPQRIEDIFMNTRIQVEKISEGKQRPWEEARLKGIFYLK
jgi:hypothetical protein